MYTNEHIFRRCYHILGFVLLPFIYYSPVMKHKFWLYVLIISTIFAERYRLKHGLLLPCMRRYEQFYICAQTWTIIGTCIVLLTTRLAIAIPIFWMIAFGDPLLGEMRSFNVNWCTSFITVLSLLFGIGVICHLKFDTPWWVAIILPPLMILAENPCIPHVDDNALMLLIPLMILLGLERHLTYHFIHQ